jgi:hypothetical protein
MTLGMLRPQCALATGKSAEKPTKIGVNRRIDVVEGQAGSPDTIEENRKSEPTMRNTSSTSAKLLK